MMTILISRRAEAGAGRSGHGPEAGAGRFGRGPEAGAARFGHRRAAGAIFGTALLAVTLAVAAPAEAAGTVSSPVGLSAIKARASAAIAARQAAIAARISLLSTGSPHLTTSDRQALLTLLQSDRSGLSTLGQKIAADTDLATAQIDYRTIFTGYRIFALAMPQVRLVRATDTLQSVALPRLTDAQTRLSQALASAGKTGQAASAMADLATQIQSIQSATGGLSGKLLALTPAQWNADHTVLAPAREALLGARSDLFKARADIVAAEAVLKS